MRLNLEERGTVDAGKRSLEPYLVSGRIYVPSQDLLEILTCKVT